MSTVVEVRLPWGRYHATPWGRSVNEATVEWPPSPWRIVRALYTVWQYRAPDLPDHLVTRALGQLSSAPEFHLPPHAEAHTRHYLPDNSSGKAKVFDPFVVTERDASLLIRWEGDLAEEERDALSRLCSLLPYLGRAESICTAELKTPDASVPTEGWLQPGALGDLNHPTRRVLVPNDPLDIDALIVTTGETRKKGLLSPAGSRWVTYPTPPLYETPVSVPRQRPTSEPRVQAALLSLDAPVLPSIHDTVWVGHVAHKAAVDAHGTYSRTLFGKDDLGRPLLLGHRHAHYLPLDLDHDRLLDAIIVWAPDGLTRSELAALGKIRKLYGPPSFRTVRISLSAVGRLTDLLGPTANSTTGTARNWVSATPFIPYRHRKRESMKSFFTEELRRDAATRGLPAISLVGAVPGTWLDYRRSRPGVRWEPPGYGLCVRFDEPVPGPVTFGALTHFGLGRFKLVDGA